MNREHKLFIKVLSDHINRRQSQVNIVPDWGIISELSQVHQVGGIIYYQCREFLPNEHRLRLEESFNKAIFYGLNRKRVVSVIYNALQDEKITYSMVKGLTVADYYPIPALRTMGDCDFIVAPGDMNKTINVLKRLGFEGYFNTGIHSWGFDKDGIHYEVHDRFIQGSDYAHPAQEEFFNQFEKYIHTPDIDWSFHFLYLIMHIRKHLINQGVGFRQFMDLAIIGKNNRCLNWMWINERLESLNLMRFAQTCAGLINEWFDVQLPIPQVKLDQAFIEKATNIVLANGVFGFHNNENNNNSMLNELLKHDGTRMMKRANWLIERMFPSYEELCNGIEFGFLKERAFLLPVAWGYRAYLMLIGRKTSAFDVIGSVMISNSEIDKHIIELKEWGLD